MSGQNRIVNAEMARPTTPKGSALKSAMDTSAFERKILEVKGNEKQPYKNEE
jgi:hypothetical protein